MFILALDAGHGKNTSGKRCNKTLDEAETREWVLNARICDRIEDILQEYDGIVTERMDDPLGDVDIPPNARVNHANRIRADIYLSIHHNNGMRCSDSGGIEAYIYKKSNEKSKTLQKYIYEYAVRHTDLSGDRVNPLKTADYTVLRQTNMPAVQLECGYMDSRTDVPVILSENHVDRIATACAAAVLKVSGIADEELLTRLLPHSENKAQPTERKGFLSQLFCKMKK